jgi:hypothetical protein
MSVFDVPMDPLVTDKAIHHLRRSIILAPLRHPPSWNALSSSFFSSFELRFGPVTINVRLQM